MSNTQTINRGNEMTNETARQIEQNHNVIIDAETEQYNINDQEYGWQPISQEWIDETKN